MRMASKAEKRKAEPGIVKKEGVLYQERAHFGPWTFAMLGGVMAIFVVAMFVSMTYPDLREPTPEWVRLVMFPALMCLVVFALASFINMKFVITDSAVVASMWPSKTVIRFDDIDSIEVIPKLPWWIGWGSRLWKRDGWVTAYISKRGPSLLIRRKRARFRNVILSVRDPEAFKKAIEKAMR